MLRSSAGRGFLSTLSLRRATQATQAAFTRIGFLSTLSLRRATFQGPRLVRHGVDFYPRSPCGERREQAIKAEQTARISIHALLAESDPFLRSDPMMRRYFYPRSPCGERLEEVSGDTWQRDFYPRSPCGERLNELLEQSASYHISIHALLAESDRL